MTHSKTTRRDFLSRCAAVSAAAALSPEIASPASAGEGKPKVDYRTLLADPVRELLRSRGEKPSLDKILSLYPRTTGEPAFDPKLIAAGAAKIETNPPINTGHPLLDLSVKTGLAHIDATFRGDHPKYGAGTYAQEVHDGFPPTIIAAVDALSAWGIHGRAAQLFRYWLLHFVKADGTINYYGPSIAEYGQLLHTAALLDERAGPAGWWNDGFKPLERIAELLLRLRAAAVKADGLIAGGPEADMKDRVAKYFHNNAWVVKGLRRWADLCQRRQASPTTPPAESRRVAAALAEDTLRAIRHTWPADPWEWWLPAQVERLQPPSPFTSLVQWDESAYTNYRYWPELLSSGLLPAEMGNRIVESRLSAGGQFCGMTRWSDCLDDWPLADYLYGLWSLGRKNDFLLTLYGHTAYSQAEGHLTAYESVTFPPGRKHADYCLPCQLVAARAARLLVK